MSDDMLTITQQELNAMHDPIARAIWNLWIDTGKAELVRDDEKCQMPNAS